MYELDRLADEICDELERRGINSNVRETPKGKAITAWFGDAQGVIAPSLGYKNLNGILNDCGGDIETAVSRASDMLEEALRNLPATDVGFLFRYDEVRSSVCIAARPLSSYDFSKTPHEELGEIALYLEVVIRDFPEAGSNGKVTIDNKLLQKWGVNYEEVLAQAKQNSHVSIRRMEEVIFGLTGIEPEEMASFADPSSPQLYVLTDGESAERSSAGPVLYDPESGVGILADKIGCDLALLPSSRYEILAVNLRPEEDLTETAETLTQMITGINIEAVAENDVLGNEPLFYDRSKRQIMTKEDYLAVHAEKKEDSSYHRAPGMH